jgi:hypothetical protein
MTQIRPGTAAATGSAGSPARIPGETYLFGIPIGGLGWFATLLMGAAAGFATFFAATFLGILGVAIANGAGHANLSFAASYRDVGFPVGALVLVVSLGYLITLRIKRMARKGR